MKKKGLYFLAFLLPVQIVFIIFLAGYPELVENWYSRLLYPQISKLMRYGHGFLPFSLGDLLYTFFGILIILWIIKRFQQKFRNPRFWLIDTLAVLSVVYACFHIFWGFNYYRLPLHETLEIEKDYTTEELYSLSEILITESNKLHKQLTDNDSVSVVIPYSKDEIFKKTIAGYANISKDYPELTYKGESLKRSLYSIPLSYMGFNGYLNPFTGEAQVNTQIVSYKIPTTASHEIGHQLGFAKENEANFIACLSTMNHPDSYFRYSGYTFALRYCLSELYRRDPEKFESLKAKINPGILENYREVEDFWLAHQNPFEPIFQAFYNRFLIVNNQADGMKSYSYVVALLVNYFSKEKNKL
ncbi:Protein of unknown function [Salegentibacter holothuriorum]|uniref:Amino acid permease n=1 Tax=Salegentibacter holothuriorum TaxID=241145 RepID=A0A1T5AYE3_9FLAO|nr:DUF3810 domain-containing protein [Salegentibacter holothuriorum]SKB40071.1 Protein of unknown function [Salegentibacter holothuriorum]